MGCGNQGAPEGHVRPSRHAAAYWRDESKKIGGPVKARIINTSSTSGIYGNVGQTNYGAAKAGIAAFTIIAARELRRYGVTVNAISPSAQTRMTEGLRELTAEQRAHARPEMGVPDGRLPGQRGSPGYHRPRDPGRLRPHRCVRGLAARRRSRPSRRSRYRRIASARDDPKRAQELAAWTAWSWIEGRAR